MQYKYYASPNYKIIIMKGEKQMQTETQVSSYESVEINENKEVNELYLSFYSNNQLFGVPITDVIQIVGMEEITPIPDSPRFVMGVINIRGCIIPIIDVRIRFGHEALSNSNRACIVITHVSDMFIGFSVDSVDAIIKVTEEEITPPPKVIGDLTNYYLTGIYNSQDKVIMLINTKRLLTEQEFEFLTNLDER